MLHEFLTEHRDDLIERCREKVAKRSSPAPTAEELLQGIPLFLTQIITTLRAEQQADLAKSVAVSGSGNPDAAPASSEIGTTASEHGDDLHRRGFTVDQVVHDYGDLCQAVTDLAVERSAPIGPSEFRTLNRCLDNAIADAVTRFGHERELSMAIQAAHDTNERLGFLAHELRGKLNAAGLAVESIKRGTVGIAGATGAILDRSLIAMRDIIDRSLVEVRLGAGQSRRERVQIQGLFEDVRIFAGMEASAKRLALVVRSIETGLAVHADRQTLVSAVSNLLQNAIKFTPTGGRVALSAHASGDRVMIEVADECGGLAPGDPGDLFRPFVQRDRDRTGLGLGLSISQRGVESNDGQLYVRNLPGTGCVFTIDLPMLAA